MPLKEKDSNGYYHTIKQVIAKDGTEIDTIYKQTSDGEYAKTFSAIREYDGKPPLKFSSYNKSLTNYRVYGATETGPKEVACTSYNWGVFPDLSYPYKEYETPQTFAFEAKPSTEYEYVTETPGDELVIVELNSIPEGLNDDTEVESLTADTLIQWSVDEDQPSGELDNRYTFTTSENVKMVLISVSNKKKPVGVSVYETSATIGVGDASINLLNGKSTDIKNGGMYDIPVKIEGRNLFDKDSMLQLNTSCEWNATPPTTIVFKHNTNRNCNCSTFIPVRGNAIYTVSERGLTSSIQILDTDKHYIKAFPDHGTTVHTFRLPKNAGYICFNLAKNLDLSSFMLVEGDTLPDHYIPYKAPITTDISLPAELYDGEYIDYAEQKMYKKKKNLAEGATVFFNQRMLDSHNIGDSPNIITPSKMNVYIVPITSSDKYQISYTNTGIIACFDSDMKYLGRRSSNFGNETTGRTYHVLENTAYIMFNVDGSISSVSVIEGTSLDGMDEMDVELPEISTLTGYNKLSIDTKTQPSKIYIKGGIKNMEELQNGS